MSTLYSKHGFNIFTSEHGLVIHNTNKKFKDGHTHVKSFDMAKLIIDDIYTKKIPKTRNEYLIESYIRLSDCEKYTEKLVELAKTRENKSQNHYININKGVKNV